MACYLFTVNVVCLCWVRVCLLYVSCVSVSLSEGCCASIVLLYLGCLLLVFKLHVCCLYMPSLLVVYCLCVVCVLVAVSHV